LLSLEWKYLLPINLVNLALMVWVVVEGFHLSINIPQ
jgi:NADH:ubiquinone oxidoreductase subunit H